MSQQLHLEQRLRGQRHPGHPIHDRAGAREEQHLLPARRLCRLPFQLQL